MSWQDMGLYWAWRGDAKGYTNPPCEKVIDYKDGQAIGYWHGEQYIKVNGEEIRRTTLSSA